MAERYLIDASGVIKYLNETFPNEGLSFMDGILDKESLISFITQIELLAWEPSNPDDLKVYKSFVAQSVIMGVTDAIIQETIEIWKMCKLKLPDALIAATAIMNDLILIADNDKDFKRVHGLKYINPQHMK